MSPIKSFRDWLSRKITESFEAEIDRNQKQIVTMREELGDFEYTDDQRRRLLEKARKLSPESIEKLGIDMEALDGKKK